MRAVIQRVEEARVTVDETVVGEISKGLLVFLGIEIDDSEEDLAFLKRKILNLRIFSDSDGKMNRSLVDTGGAVLLVSQFTLYGDCRKGNRPSFIRAAPPARADELYQELIRQLRSEGVAVESGEFQAMMKVNLVNDGPVTLIVDSKKS
ncbi:MAG: D-tyrosyl-tRNA(Tyr) deacylase [Acidobacteria bacterium]|nr:D-tyrosyl-tRNA(Tyr) deacylase [Acidobacteriota bacterium]